MESTTSQPEAETAEPKTEMVAIPRMTMREVTEIVAEAWGMLESDNGRDAFQLLQSAADALNPAKRKAAPLVKCVALECGDRWWPSTRAFCRETLKSPERVRLALNGVRIAEVPGDLRVSKHPTREAFDAAMAARKPQTQTRRPGRPSALVGA